MSIPASALKLMKSLVVTDTSSNGGHRSYNEVQSGTSQNMFGNTFMDERESGSTKVRFGCLCNHSTGIQIAYNMMGWLDNETAGDDYVYFILMDHGAVQSEIVGNEDLYTPANLKYDVSAGATTIVVEVPATAAADVYARDLTDAFVEGRKIRITNKEYPDSVTGTAEVKTITGTPVVTNEEVSFQVSEQVANTYTVAGGGRVCVLYELGNISAALDAMTKTSASGTIDDTTYPVTLTNANTIEETWTFVFSDANNFTCSGARVGSVGAGTIGTDFAPNNPNTSQPYFTINHFMWGGTWAQNDEAELVTYDSSRNIAEVRITPAGASPQSANRSTIAMSCESV